MKSEILEIMKEVIPYVEPSSGSSGNGHLPKFELSPRDFVAFSEKDLDEGGQNSYKLVNATSNLKRAVDRVRA